MMKLNSYIRFYECCKPVRGYSRTAIYDLQRSQVFFIPNELLEIISNSMSKTIQEIFDENKFQLDLLKKQLSYMYENEIIFCIETPERFPKIDEKIDNPHLLEFIYMDVSEINEHTIKFLENIDDTGVSNLVFVFKNRILKEVLNTLLTTLHYSKIKCINIISKYDKNLSSIIKDIIIPDPRIRRSVFYDCHDKVDENFDQIFFSEKKIDVFLREGISSLNNLTINLEAYLESLNYNLFYNKKIFIEKNGDVVRFFNDGKKLGNICNDELRNIIINNKNLKEFWSISKDEIEHCKECEFRYICPDNRIPKKIKNKYMHETDCKYNPKTNKWITD